MRIMLVGSNHYDTPIYSLHEIFKSEHSVNVFDPFLHNGLPVPIGGEGGAMNQLWLYFLRAFLREPFKIANMQLIESAVRFSPDLIFVIQMQSIMPQTIAEIKKKTKAVVIGWFMDAITNFERGYFLYADYDALFFKDKFIVKVLRQKFSSNNIYYLPQCCDPAIHFPAELTSADRAKYGCDLTIAGNLYYYRARVLDPLYEYDFKIWGAKQSWVSTRLNQKHLNRPVYGIEKSKAMRASKIVINNNHYAEIGGVNKRTFEIAAMKAFQLTDGPGIAELFTPMEEVAVFESANDLKEKVGFYLNHPEERMRIAENGYRRAVSDHCYSNRWCEILHILREQGFSF